MGIRAERAGHAGFADLAGRDLGVRRGSQPQEQAAAPPPAAPAPEPPKAPYYVYVTNEIGGDLTVIDGGTNQVVATIPLGKRPRGIKVSPDGTKLFVALSGSPMAPPGTDESKLPPPDRTADGIGIVDIAARKVSTVLTSGTDPEQISLSADGSKVFVSNEDAGVASIIDVASNKIIGNVKVGGEPEGVTTSPNGQWVYVTSEEDNQVAVIDTASNKVIKMLQVGARPRSSAFLPDSSKRVRHRRERRHGARRRHEKSLGDQDTEDHRRDGAADGRDCVT